MRSARRFLPLVLCVTFGCHLGPFYDIYRYEIGPDVSRLSVLADQGIRGGQTHLAEALALLGPPTSIERRRDVQVLTWRKRAMDRHWAGVGIGMLGFNIHVFDHDSVSEPEQRIVLFVENDVVTAIGNSYADSGDG